MNRIAFVRLSSFVLCLYYRIDTDKKTGQELSCPEEKVLIFQKKCAIMRLFLMDVSGALLRLSKGG